MITITVGDKTSQAMIVDECMGCGPGNLDFSEGLFNFFGAESEGVLHGSWSYGGDAKPSSSPSPSPTPKAKTSSTPKPSPKPSSKAKPSSTKAKSSSSSIGHLTTLTATPSSVTPNINVQTAGGLTSQEANASGIYAINMAFLGLGGLVASA
ncbi:hypothetical protein PILCRDRAFT_822118 [Piloderma croceum F 1598]|uniref:RlpA-like protein double-psi beta-barrel domain-containing protein n=1 Tax=Piloderma croceum (strain F 1598) TaxID=765440 RepID=A0A0C3B3Q9_PILCF|nr:hypothetical protein PILCRDRAFT_822118 [Piloderma croceum F 1598]